MIKNVEIIGLTGVAGCGKDTFFKLAKEELESQGVECLRFSLGDFLRRELWDFCMAQFKIDLFNCSRAEKDNLRDWLVFHGNYRRDTTEGAYWGNQVYEEMVKSVNPCKKQCFIITDIRYNKHKYDDLYLIKDKLKGKLIHITQCYEEFGLPLILEPANEQERIFDPQMYENASYHLLWPKANDINDIKSFVSKTVNEFILT